MHWRLAFVVKVGLRRGTITLLFKRESSSGLSENVVSARCLRGVVPHMRQEPPLLPSVPLNGGGVPHGGGAGGAVADGGV